VRLTPALPLALLFLALAPPAFPIGPAGNSTDFEMARPGAIVVPVKLNGAGPYLFLLDTGSSHSVIDERLAGTLGAPAVARTTVTSPLGDETRPVVRLDHLEIGPVVAKGVLASVVNPGTIDPAARVQGLIGLDVLAGLRYTLDFDNRRVHWGAAASRDRRGHSKFALRLEGHRFLIDLTLGTGRLSLVPDSGAGGLVLFERNGRPLPLVWTDSSRAVLATLNDRRLVRQVRIAALPLGLSTLRNVPAVLIPRPDAESGEGDGLLPLHLFRHVTFDGPSRLLTIWP
jgi:predicted aspartyl protease